jgi:hypothetical protein
MDMKKNSKSYIINCPIHQKQRSLVIEAKRKINHSNRRVEKTIYAEDVTVITTVKDQLLQPLVNTPTKLDINQEGIDKMASLIENSPHQFKLSFTSTVNETPLNFTLKFSFNIKMTANPL